MNDYLHRTIRDNNLRAYRLEVSIRFMVAVTERIYVVMVYRFIRVSTFTGSAA